MSKKLTLKALEEEVLAALEAPLPIPQNGTPPPEALRQLIERAKTRGTPNKSPRRI